MTDRGVLYVTDLDGTLLQDDASLSPQSFRILDDLLRQGAPITVASARSLVSIRHVLRGLPLRLPVIELNGACVSDLATGAHLRIHALPGATATALVALLLEAGTAPFLATFDGTCDRLYAPPAANDGMRWYVDERRRMGDTRLHAVADVRAALDERVVCVTAIGPPAPMADLARRLAAFDGTVDVTCWENPYQPGWHWISVHDRRATKEQALEALLEVAGLGDPQVMAFGDQVNDLGLLRRAHRGVAVANAIEPVKAAADEVIGANTEDSVARRIQHDWEIARPSRLERRGA